MISVKELRDKLGITQHELAALTNIPRDRISKWEQGKGQPKAADAQHLQSLLKQWEELPTDDRRLRNVNPDQIITNPLLKTRAHRGSKAVKYYDTDFAAGNVSFYEDNVEAPAYEMQIPAFAGCIAFNVFGDSMESLIKGGSVVFGRKLDDWQSFVEFGQIYGIVMKDDRRFLKYIRKSNDSSKFLLKSENENYDEFEIPKNKIHNIWLIEGWMLKRT